MQHFPRLCGCAYPCYLSLSCCLAWSLSCYAAFATVMRLCHCHAACHGHVAMLCYFATAMQPCYVILPWPCYAILPRPCGLAALMLCYLASVRLRGFAAVLRLSHCHAALSLSCCAVIVVLPSHAWSCCPAIVILDAARSLPCNAILPLLYRLSRGASLVSFCLGGHHTA